MGGNFDVLKILNLGTIGLGFLLAFLAYRLLSKEQSVEKPRDNILRAVNRFMMFSVILCIFGLASEFYRNYHSPSSSLSGISALDPNELSSAIPFANSFLKKLDEDDVQGAFALTSNFYKSQMTFKDLSENVSAAKRAYGKVLKRDFVSADKGLVQGTQGVFMIYQIHFNSAWAQKPTMLETVMLTKNESEQFEVFGVYAK